MGAKNSKVKKGEKKGAAAGDESSDQVDKTATLPASFKKKVKQTTKPDKSNNKNKPKKQKIRPASGKRGRRGKAVSLLLFMFSPNQINLDKSCPLNQNQT